MTVDRRIIDLYNEYVHTSLPRREFMTRLASIAGSSAAAMAILPFIEPNYAQARQIDVAEHVRALRHRALVARREVVAELVHQLRGVGVQIEHADLAVKRARLVGREAHDRTIRSRATSSTDSAESTRLNGGIT